MPDLSMHPTIEDLKELPRLPIESSDGFPTEQLSNLVKIEGRGPEVSRPPLYLHKWWAKRFGSVFRSILLSILLDGETDIWGQHYHSHHFPDVTIFDPFMGSGTTLFEATRLGCKTIGCDINPVAWWSARAALEQPESWERLEATYKEIEAEAVRHLGKYFRTECPNCSLTNGYATSRHVRWAHVVACRFCGERIRLIRSYNLGKYKGGHWLLCPTCDDVFWTDESLTRDLQCRSCNSYFNPKNGNVTNGLVACPNHTCGKKFQVREAMAIKENPLDNAEMIAVLYDCPAHGWGLKTPAEIDKEVYADAVSYFREIESSLPIPRQQIPSENRTDPRPVNYGYKFWQQMFTPRQLLFLGWLGKRIRNLPPEPKHTFVTLFSQLVNYTNAFCVSRPNRPAAVSWIFRMHAFVPPTDFLENNPLGGKRASGTFQNLFWRSCRSAYEFREAPAERKISDDSGRKTTAVQISGETIKPSLVDTWDEFTNTPGSVALLLCQSSEKVPIPDKQVSYIVTDPPFYDNVMYGELAEFNYVWLREILQEEFPLFDSPIIQNDEELLVSGNIGKGDEFYTEGLYRIFKESHRVLEDTGALVFTFHHRSSSAWKTLLQALLNAHFCVSAVHPVRSESDRSLHIMAGDSIEHDVVIVCRKAGDPSPTEWNILVEYMRFEAQKSLSRIPEVYHYSPSNVGTIVFGKCLKIFSQHYPEIYDSGERVSLVSAIETAEQIAYSIASKLNQSPETSQ